MVEFVFQKKYNTFALVFYTFTQKINYPIAKINLGLNVVRKREDGYHDLETVFYPVEIKDALEVYPMDSGFPSAVACDLKVTNATVDCDEQKNLVVKAYRQLAAMSCPGFMPTFIRLFRLRLAWVEGRATVPI